jgi:hypothetical protein
MQVLGTEIVVKAGDSWGGMDAAASLLMVDRYVRPGRNDAFRHSLKQRLHQNDYSTSAGINKDIPKPVHDIVQRPF